MNRQSIPHIRGQPMHVAHKMDAIPTCLNSSNVPSRMEGDMSRGERSCRSEASLTVLTMRFIEMMQKTDDDSVDINTMANTLGVKKRRMYDIINVLEGIGYLKKLSKNKASLKREKFPSLNKDSTNILKLEREMEQMKSEEQKLDDIIARKRDIIKSYREHNKIYVRSSEIRSCESVSDHTLIAVQIPSDTTVEFTEVDEGPDSKKKRYMITFQSERAPLDLSCLPRSERGSRVPAPFNSGFMMTTAPTGLPMDPIADDADDSGFVKIIPPEDFDNPEHRGHEYNGRSL